MEEILFDPQTSGGLLAGIRPEDAQSALEKLKKLGLPCAAVGRVPEQEREEDSCLLRERKNEWEKKN